VRGGKLSLFYTGNDPCVEERSLFVPRGGQSFSVWLSVTCSNFGHPSLLRLWRSVDSRKGHTIPSKSVCTSVLVRVYQQHSLYIFFVKLLALRLGLKKEKITMRPSMSSFPDLIQIHVEDNHMCKLQCMRVARSNSFTGSRQC
jgi:hypothetical protein